MKSVVLKADEIAKTMKETLLKNRSITQPKLRTDCQPVTQFKTSQNSPTSNRPEIKAMSQTRFGRQKVNKSQFLTLNADLNDQLNCKEYQLNASYNHVIPTAAVFNVNNNARAVKEVHPTENPSNLLKSRSKSTHMSATMVNLGGKGFGSFASKLNTLNRDIPDDPFRTQQHSGRKEHYATLDADQIDGLDDEVKIETPYEPEISSLPRKTLKKQNDATWGSVPLLRGR